LSRALAEKWRGVTQTGALSAVKAAIKHTSLHTVREVISGLQEGQAPQDPVAALVALAKTEFDRAVGRSKAVMSIVKASGWSEDEAGRLVGWAASRGIRAGLVASLAGDLAGTDASSVLQATERVDPGLRGIEAWRALMNAARRRIPDGQAEKVRKVIENEFLMTGLVITWKDHDYERAAEVIRALERAGAHDPGEEIRKAVRKFLLDRAYSSGEDISPGAFWRDWRKYASIPPG